jgi:lysophospholipase L1-like esterase
MKKKILLIFLSLLLVGCSKKVDNPAKEVEQDNTVPTISIVNEQIFLDGDTEFNPISNVNFEFGASGGKVTCDKDKLEVGENTIICTAKGNNDLTATVSYKVVMSKTYKKNAIFFGDSIVYGFKSSPVGYSWANYIGDHYDLNLAVNAGISDYRVSTYDNPRKWLVDEVKSHYNDPNSYDFVILQGGINDLLYNTPMGSISSSKDINSFDVKTFSGGLESYLYHVISKWPNARIGYIITYNTPNYTERGLKWSYSDYKAYYDRTKEILNKWNIKYLDLSTDEFNNLLAVEQRKYLPDYLHLNNDGYKVVSPYIYDFMQTLDKYS